jgi:hypothetical protein
MTDQPSFEPPQWQAPQQQPPQQQPFRPPQPVPPVKKTTGSPTVLVGVISGVVGLALGGAVMAGGDSGTTTKPAATVTATATATATKTVTQTASTDQPTTATPTRKPTSKPKPKPTKKATPTATNVTSRQWAKIVKSPDNYIGKRYIIYGVVTQFDAATGDDAFLADTAYKNTTDYGYFDGENTMLTGDTAKLSEVVEKDVFRATVTVLGSYSYDTQVGGNTTVPHLEINKIKVIGHNK